MSGYRRDLAERLLTFGSLPLLGVVAPLAVLPLVARSVEASVWGALLTAQAIGSVTGVLVLSGWAVYGQAQVALSDDLEIRANVYVESIRSRAFAFAFIFPAACLLTWTTTHGVSAVLSILMMLSSAWSGFTLSWYAIGCGKSVWIWRYEVLPDLVANLLCIPAIALYGAVWTYPAFFIAATAVGLGVFHKHEFGSLLPIGDYAAARVNRSERIRAAGVSIIGALYGSAPLPTASALRVGSVPALASGDRIWRYAAFSIHSLGNALQEWVLGSSERERFGRQRVGIFLHAVLGICGGLGIAFLGPGLGSLLFGSDVAPSRSVCLGFGIGFTFVSFSTPIVRNVLVPGGKTGSVLRSTLVSACFGLPAMIVGGLRWGAEGVAFGFAFTEILNCLILVLSAQGAVTRRSSEVAAVLGLQSVNFGDSGEYAR